MTEEQLTLNFSKPSQPDKAGNVAASENMAGADTARIYQFPTHFDDCTRKFRILLEVSKQVMVLDFVGTQPIMWQTRFKTTDRSVFSLVHSDVTDFLNAISLTALKLSEKDRDAFYRAYNDFEKTIRLYKRVLHAPGASIQAIEQCLDDMPQLIEYAKRSREPRKSIAAEVHADAQLPLLHL